MNININRYLNSIGLHLMRKNSYDLLRGRNGSNSYWDERLFFQLRNLGNLEKLNTAMNDSASLLYEDVLALALSSYKKEGFFVEIGAGNGNFNSNTFMLEEKYGWYGILSESRQEMQESLITLRTSKLNFQDLAFSNENIFSKTQYLNKPKENNSHHKNDKSKYDFLGSLNDINATTINQLFETYAAPNRIDFFSVKASGKELEVLRNVNFKKYTFNLITVEHNFAPRRDAIHDLLAKHGYQRCFSDLSRWDDWYVWPVDC